MRKLQWNVVILTLAFAVSESARVAKKCRAPPAYPNIKLSAKYARKQSFNSGDAAYYKCAEDFVPRGGSRAAHCQDGRWSPLTLECEKLSCGNAGDLLNGQFKYEGNSYVGEKVYAVCDEGYTVKGVNYMECKRDGWMGKAPTCEENSKDVNRDAHKRLVHPEGETPCLAPVVAHSVKTDNDTPVYLPGDNVSVTCGPGFQLDGAPRLTCGPSGQWQPKPPQCRPTAQDRPQPSTDKPSEFHFLDPITTDVTTSCFPPDVPNSVKSESISEYRAGEKLTFTCRPGFQLDGAQHIVCGPSGQWQPEPPQCRPAPQEKTPPHKDGSCGVPQTNAKSNANLADKYITRKFFASGERVSYVCDVGYASAGGSRYRKCTNGKWTPLWMKCERKMCGSAGEIMHGRFNYNGDEFGDTATAVCDEGFILVGQATRRCMNNGWSGRIPNCEAMHCDDPPQVPNADLEAQLEETYAYRTVVRYRCRLGTLVGPQDVWCTKDGTWSAPPQCKDMTCSAPNVTSAYWSRAHLKRFEHRDTLSIHCYPGYKLAGPRSISCGENGQWLPKLPICQRLY